MIRGVAPLVMVVALGLCPAHGDALNALAGAAAAALKSGDAANADNLATQALATGALSADDQAHVLLNRGLARDKLQRPADALIDFNAALELGVLSGDDKARALFDRGVVQDELGRASEALADYSAALRVNASFAAALNNRANVYRRVGKLEDAKRDYLASLNANNLQPEYPQYGLGQIAEAQKDPAAARDWYKRALNANPNYKPAADRIAVVGDVFMPVLKPPPVVVADAVASEKIVLRPPVSKPEPKVAFVQHKFEPLMPHVASAAYAPTLEAPDLRPAIVEALAPAIPPTEPSGNASQVQLGAWQAEADAAVGWNQIVRKTGALLNGLTPQIVAADIPGKGRYYRLRTEPPDGVSAGGLCGKLQALGLACMAVR